MKFLQKTRLSPSGYTTSHHSVLEWIYLEESGITQCPSQIRFRLMKACEGRRADFRTPQPDVRMLLGLLKEILLSLRLIVQLRLLQSLLVAFLRSEK